MPWNNFEQHHEKCKTYLRAGKPQKSAANKLTYKECCEQDNYCEIWAQAWFWLMIGGIILLLIIICALGCIYCCCCRSRVCCGKDMGKVEEQKEQKESGSSESG